MMRGACLFRIDSNVESYSETSAFNVSGGLMIRGEFCTSFLKAEISMDAVLR